MMTEIKQKITDFFALRNGYVIRDGFLFAKTGHEPIFDSLIIRNPRDAINTFFKSPASKRSLEEHIQLINKYHLEKAVIICNDLSFVAKCPSLQDIAVFPSNEADLGFDFSPLYHMPNIKKLNCVTAYGLNDQLHTEVDYSRIKGIRDISAAGIGQLGYEYVPTLESLWLSGSKRHKDFSTLSCSTVLKNVTVMQCGIKTLNGLENHLQMQELALYHCRSLSDISALKHISKTLRSLTIESCPKITDFSALEDLSELEYLHLYGNNVLPNLSFLCHMEKLKIFCFTINVQNGDLTLCKNIPYVSCKNRKHYNLKDVELSKVLPEGQTGDGLREP